jgi:hypothetical protein
MKKDKRRNNTGRIEDAKALVRKILIDEAGQKLDERTVESVADKIVRSLPDAA